jgi:hypothetical protein
VKTPDRSKLLAQALTLASRAEGAVLSLRAAGGGELGPDDRAALLAKAVAREEVQLELHLRAYEQKTGERNRNFVRFRDGAMMGLGSTGVGKPFLADHRQWDVTARGGTIAASKTTKRDEGSYQIDQTVLLTEPAAVERALRGLMSSVSIGWNPTGPVMCSACNKPVGSVCYHWPGDRLSESVDGDGNKRVLRDRTGAIVVEWIYTAAELVETSEVSVPGVPGAGVTDIRAELSALAGGLGLPFDAPEDEPQETNRMSTKLLTALITALSLAPTATEDDAIAAVQAKCSRLTAVESLQAASSAELATVKAQIAGRAADDFVRDGVVAGKIAPGSEQETALRAYFAVAPDGAKALLAAQPRITPLGQPPQAGKPPPPTPPTSGKLAAADERIRQHTPAASAEGVIHTLMAMGNTREQAVAIVERQLAPKGA